MFNQNVHGTYFIIIIDAGGMVIIMARVKRRKMMFQSHWRAQTHLPRVVVARQVSASSCQCPKYDTYVSWRMLWQVSMLVNVAHTKSIAGLTF